jgi:hypothetical protein
LVRDAVFRILRICSSVSRYLRFFVDFTLVLQRNYKAETGENRETSARKWTVFAQLPRDGRRVRLAGAWDSVHPLGGSDRGVGPVRRDKQGEELMWVLVAYCLVIYLIGFPSTAYAYVDPGTGSVLLQGLAFVFLAVGMFFRRVQGFVNRHVLKKRGERT